MKLFIRYRFLFVIIALAAFLRLWQLGSVPPSPDWDEVALGYNAYSVLKTGRDEYSTWFPLSLRSYDDYKPPLYMYLTIPSVAIFGLEAWSVRLPSALIGIAAVVGVYFLCHELLTLTDKKKAKFYSWLPSVSAFFLAVSPWHIQFSRIAFEANVGVTLNIWGAVFFLKGLRNGKLLSISAILLSLGLYAYHSERIFLPLLVVLLAFIFHSRLVELKRYTVVALILGLVVAVPLVPVFLNKTTLTRLRGTSSLADETLLLERSVKKLEEDAQSGNRLGVFFDNRRIVWFRTVAAGYLSHYSLRWLFLTGDNPRHHAPDMGLLYLWELPFIAWGMYVVAKTDKRIAALLFGWFFVAPVAASPTTELPHAIRTLVFLPTFQIFTGFGLVHAGAWILRQKIILRYTATCIVSGLFLFNFVYYVHMYFVHMNHEFSQNWQYGYKQAAEYAQAHKEKYGKIVVSTKLEQPHMFFLFFLRYDPARYLAEGGTASGGFAEYKNKFDIYEFRPIHWSDEIKDGKTLFIGMPSEIPSPNLMAINYLDGTPAMYIADR